jgi:hypothetical protein
MNITQPDILIIVANVTGAGLGFLLDTFYTYGIIEIARAF